MRKIVLGHLGAFVPVKGALKLSARVQAWYSNLNSAVLEQEIDHGTFQ
jgi:hypothetical protein